MRNGAWLMDITHCPNNTDILRDKLWDNFKLRYSIIPLPSPKFFNSCRNLFRVYHDFTFTQGALVLSQNENTINKWGHLLSWYMIPSAVYYYPIISSKTVQEERPRSGARTSSQKVVATVTHWERLIGTTVIA